MVNELPPLSSCSNMYVHVESLYPVLHKYFLSRCRYDVLFSLKVIVIKSYNHLSSLYPLLQLAWLLTAFIGDKWLPSSELQTASRMLSLIKTEQIRPPQTFLPSPGYENTPPLLSSYIHTHTFSLFLCLFLYFV